MPLITQAFVLGAGLGMRLRPLTDDLPKPLVPIFQKPLITFAFDHSTLIACRNDSLMCFRNRFTAVGVFFSFMSRKSLALEEELRMPTASSGANRLLFTAETF
ncbi:MAG: hypothetical protein DMF40_03120 [Verrucomicrobia bacterium]|nr:MAG: hypothetical protein DMF40_03120 [Verrucomicrobiota bacterium]